MSEQSKAGLETEISEEIWNAICEALAVSDLHSSLRVRIGRAFGDYRADVAQTADVNLSDVQRILLRCAEVSDAFLHSIGPMAGKSDDGASAMARRHLTTGLGDGCLNFDDLAASIIEIRDRCRSLAPKYAARGGRTPETSRNIFIRRLAHILVEEQIPASDRAFSAALRPLMGAAGAQPLPSNDSLERAVRKIRHDYRMHVN